MSERNQLSCPLPDELPVFPLSSVLLLPRGELPLNIFEPRFIAMIEQALRENRVIGMVQGQNGDHPVAADDEALFPTGCAGKITSFEETSDGRFLITLTGISRFHIAQELPLAEGGYRRIRARWDDFARDLEPPGCLDIDRAKLRHLLALFFEQNKLSCDWDLIDNTPDDRLITGLAMICPLDAKEKQALLEARCCKNRATLFMTMLEMCLHQHDKCSGNCH